MRNAVALLLIFTLNACTFLGDKEDETLTWDIDRFYAEAKGALDAGFYSQAIELYQKLETRYPFGKYAQQALLDLAYAHYKSEDFDAAVATCERFMNLYMQNEHVDYAYYLKGLSNFNRGKGLIRRYLPTDESQRDSIAMQQAFQDFMELTTRFPDSDYAEDAKQRMRYLRNNLAQNEVNVAHYYMRRGAFVAAANRAKHAVKNYSRAPAVLDALIIMVKAYRILELNDLSNDALRILEFNYPEHPAIYEIGRLRVQ